MKKIGSLLVLATLTLGFSACNTGAVRSNGTPDYQFQSHNTHESYPRQTYTETRTTTMTSNDDYGVKADNSKVNERITRNSEWTAEDQGSSEYDIKTTQEIRKQLVDQDQFSSSAKNVKVITRDGSVVLKGPVQSLEERRRIEAIAKRVAGANRVTNVITVK